MKSLHNLTTLTNFKKHINKPASDTDDDDYLEQLIMRSSLDIERYCDRKFRARNYGNGGYDPEYQDGSGSRYLRTRQYPIISITNLYDDNERDWGSTYLKASTDYYIHNAEAGIISLESDAVKGTNFLKGWGNIRLEYVAGYDHHYVIDDENDRIDFEETASTELTANLTGDVYTAADLCTEIDTQLTAAGASVYTVTFDRFTGKFKIASDRSGGGGTFKILWSSGTNAYRNIGRTLGFEVSADDADAASHTSDFGALGIPDDLELACILLTHRRFRDSLLGDSRFDVKSKSSGIASPVPVTVTYVGGEFPTEVGRILRHYKRQALM